MLLLGTLSGRRNRCSRSTIPAGRASALALAAAPRIGVRLCFVSCPPDRIINQPTDAQPTSTPTHKHAYPHPYTSSNPHTHTSHPLPLLPHTPHLARLLTSSDALLLPARLNDETQPARPISIEQLLLLHHHPL